MDDIMYLIRIPIRTIPLEGSEAPEGAERFDRTGMCENRIRIKPVAGSSNIWHYGIRVCPRCIVFHNML